MGCHLLSLSISFFNDEHVTKDVKGPFRWMVRLSTVSVKIVMTIL